MIIGYSRIRVVPPPTVFGSDPPATAAAVGWGGAPGPAWFNQSATLVNGAIVASVGMYADAACTLTMKIILRTSSTTADVVVSQAFSHPGGGWADLTLSSAYAVPGSGSYYVGAYFSTNPSIKYNASTNRAVATTNITGSGQTIAEAAAMACPSFRATYS